jgi:hypothetical protein
MRKLTHNGDDRACDLLITHVALSGDRALPYRDIAPYRIRRSQGVLSGYQGMRYQYKVCIICSAGINYYNKTAVKCTCARQTSRFADIDSNRVWVACTGMGNERKQSLVGAI